MALPVAVNNTKIYQQNDGERSRWKQRGNICTYHVVHTLFVLFRIYTSFCFRLMCGIVYLKRICKHFSIDCPFNRFMWFLCSCAIELFNVCPLGMTIYQYWKFHRHKVVGTDVDIYSWANILVACAMGCHRFGVISENTRVQLFETGATASVMSLITCEHIFQDGCIYFERISDSKVSPILKFIGYFQKIKFRKIYCHKYINIYNIHTYTQVFCNNEGYGSKKMLIGPSMGCELSWLPWGWHTIYYHYYFYHQSKTTGALIMYSMWEWVWTVNDLTENCHIIIIMQMVTMILPLKIMHVHMGSATHSHIPRPTVRHRVLPQPESCDRYRWSGNVPECKQSSPNRVNMHVHI